MIPVGPHEQRGSCGADDRPEQRAHAQELGKHRASIPPGVEPQECSEGALLHAYASSTYLAANAITRTYSRQPAAAAPNVDRGTSPRQRLALRDSNVRGAPLSCGAVRHSPKVPRCNVTCKVSLPRF